MKPKAYLNQVSRLENEIEQIEEQIAEIRETKASAGAIRYDKANVQTSPEDTMADYVARLDELERKAIDMKCRKQELYLTILDQINGMQNGFYSGILSLRYLENMRLYEIADDLGMNDEAVYKAHGRALAAFGKQYADVLNGCPKMSG